MRIFITGANGQLAKSFINFSSDTIVYLATRDELDVTNKRQVKKQILHFKPDVVFHFASLTRGDACVLDPQKAHKINVQGTKNVIEACNLIDATLLLVSTNEVFDGKKNTPYTEDDEQKPITIAGKTKHKAEKLIRENMKKYYIVRTSWLFSPWSSNFLHAVLNKARAHKKVELVEDEVSSPTYSYDLAQAILQLMETKKYGTYHLVNEGHASRLEFAKQAFAIYGIHDVEIVPVKLEKYPRLSKPPLFSALANTKAAELHINLPKWEESLLKFLRDHTIE